MHLLIVYELITWSKDLNADFTLKYYKHSHSSYGVGFDSYSTVSLLNFDWGKNVIILGVDNSASVHIYNNKKDILHFGDGLRQKKANSKCSINFWRSRKKLLLKPVL